MLKYLGPNCHDVYNLLSQNQNLCVCVCVNKQCDICGESRGKLYRNSLYCFSRFPVGLQSIQNKKLGKVNFKMLLWGSLWSLN
jgi:hypothetical protein